MPKTNEVFIWARFSIKKQEYKEFPTLEEFSQYSEMYEQYYDKRWEEIPKIVISIEDWNFLQQRWKQIKVKKPRYLIFMLDDSGPFNKIEIIDKDELSLQDLHDVQIEHEKYVKYEHARQQYIFHLPAPIRFLQT